MHRFSRGWLTGACAAFACLLSACDKEDGRCRWATVNTTYRVTLGEYVPETETLPGCGTGFMTTGDTFTVRTREDESGGEGPDFCSIEGDATFPDATRLGHGVSLIRVEAPVVAIVPQHVEVEACRANMHGELTGQHTSEVRYARYFMPDGADHTCTVDGHIVGTCIDTWFVRIERDDGTLVVDLPE